MPVAPSGWPFESRPPETLTGMRPPRPSRPRRSSGRPRLRRRGRGSRSAGSRRWRSSRAARPGRGPPGRRRPSRRPPCAALRVSVLTSGITRSRCVQGSEVSTEARTLTLRAVAGAPWRAEQTHRGGRAVAGRAAHQACSGTRSSRAPITSSSGVSIWYCDLRVAASSGGGSSPTPWRTARTWCRTCACAPCRPGRTPPA